MPFPDEHGTFPHDSPAADCLFLCLPPEMPATMNMGLTAEALQKMYNISREAQDEFSFRSQQRTKKAIDSGFCAQDIMPIIGSPGKEEPPIEFKVDEFPRAETTMEGLAKLPPAFIKDGTVTAGNSSGRNDGAAFVLMMTKEKAEQLGLQAVAKWLAGGDYGVDPKIMGIAPAYAVPQALKRAGIKMSQLDVIECNEAFAVQNLAVAAELEKQTGEKVDWEKWNPNGGAISYRSSQRRIRRPYLHLHHARADEERRQIRLLQLLLRRRFGCWTVIENLMV